MNIEFKRVTKKLPEYKQIKQLYFSAFPSEERAPFYLNDKTNQKRKCSIFLQFIVRKNGSE